MTEKSKHSLTESLSALADGEATPLETHRLLKACADESELKARWERYHLAGSVIRRDLDVMAPTGFAASISEALETEASPAVQRRSWWQNAGRVAVAASVAGAVLLGVQQYPEMAGDRSGEPSMAGAGFEADESDRNGSAGSQPVSLPSGYQAPGFPAARTASALSGYEPGSSRSGREVIFVPVQAESVQVPAEEIRAYLNQLMQEHSVHAASNSNQGVLPFARVSSEDDN